MYCFFISTVEDFTSYVSADTKAFLNQYTILKWFDMICRDDHTGNILTSMKTIMIVILEESEDINEDILRILISALGRKKVST